MKQTKIWRTLGITTNSRIWVTLNAHNLTNTTKQTRIKKLTQSGQFATTYQAASKLSYFFGKNFLPLKRLLVVFIIVLCAEWSTHLVMFLLSYIYYLLSVINPLTISIFCLTVSTFLFYLWVSFIQTRNSLAPWVGVISCCSGFFGLSLHKMRARLSESKRSSAKKPTSLLEMRGELYRTSSIDNPLTAERALMVSVYRLLKLLSREEGQRLTFPTLCINASILNVEQSTCSLPILKTPNMQLLLINSGISLTWPSIEHALSQQNISRALQVFQWHSLQAAAPAVLKASGSLWHAHKVGNLNMAMITLAELHRPIEHAAFINEQGTNSLLSWLPNSLNLTTYLMEHHRYPVKYDLMQTSRIAENAAWSHVQHSRKFKISLNAPCPVKNTKQ